MKRPFTLLAGAAVILAVAPLISPRAPAYAKRSKRHKPSTFEVVRRPSSGSLATLLNTRTGQVYREIEDKFDPTEITHGWREVPMPSDMAIGDVDTYHYEFDVFTTGGYYSDYGGYSFYTEDALINTATGDTWRYDEDLLQFVQVERR